MRIPFHATTAKSARAIRRATLLGVVAALATVGGIAYAHSRGPSIPTPAITSAPSGSTTQRSATFKFSGHSGHGSGYQCSLDGSSFTSCSSPKTYTGLGYGRHTFSVRVRTASGHTGSAASRTWTVISLDTTPPPAPQIVDAPPSLSDSDRATLRFVDAEHGVSFRCRIDNAHWDSCSSPETYRRLRDGWHVFSVVARDAAGNVSPAASVSWKVDTVAPPKPKIVQKPSSQSASSDATFAFTDKEPGVDFECQLDNGAWSDCASPTTYSGLAAGKHRFEVRAVDAAGNRSDDAEATWKVTQQSGLPFTIAGDFSGSLAPGLSGDLALTVRNPNSEPIYVTSLTVTIQPGSTKPGCDGPTNLAVVPSNVSAANPLLVPAGGSAAVPSGGVTAPEIEMLNLPVNQDACKGATFTFSFGGSAHS